MAFTVPSREEIFSAFIGDYASAQPTKNVSRGSDPFRLGRVVSGAAWTILAKVLFYVKQMLPDTAEADMLERWGTVFNLPRKLPAGSTGVSSLTVTGTIGNAVTTNAQLAHADGTLYKVSSVGAVIGGGGSAVVSVVAISKGIATNKGVGEILTFVSPPTGITAAATVSTKFVGGVDIESLDDYRVRVLAHIGDPPEGGAIHDYIEWAKRITGVVDAYVWTGRRGAGTVDVTVLGPGSGSNRVIADTSAVSTYIESVRPANVKDWSLLTPSPQTQDVQLTITIDDATYKWDWNDAGVGYAVTASDSTAKTITVPTAPSTLIAGMRLTVLGEEATVTNRTGNVLTLTFANDYDGNAVTWFSQSPNGSDIRASGDLVTPVKNAIIGLFNTLGPARSSYSKTSWLAELKLSKLLAAVTDVPGVDDATVTTPASNVVPVDTYGTSVPFLVPRFIKVWKP